MRPHLLCLLLAAAPLHAADDEAPTPPPIVEKAPLPDDLPEEALRAIEEAEQQPTVTIIKREETVIEEYRLGSQVFMVRIVPAKGVPYYLLDTDGDGHFDSRRNPHDAPPVVQWPLIKW